jgi:hypothetical protein
MLLTLLMGCPTFGDIAVDFADTGSTGDFDCPSGEVLEELGTQILALEALATVLVLEADQAPVFLELPGARYGSWFLAPTTCKEPTEICVGGLCYRVGCGAEWTVETWPDVDASFGTWTGGTYEQAVAAADGGVDLAFRVSGAYPPDGSRFEGLGAGRIDGGLTLEWWLRNNDRDVELSYAKGVGAVTMDGIDIATWDGDRFDDSGCVR